MQANTSAPVATGRGDVAAAGAGVAAGLLWSFGQMAYDVAPALGSATTTEIVRFYADQAGTHRVGVTVAGVVFTLFVVYLGWLRGAFTRAEGGQGTWAPVCFAAGIVVATFYLLSAAVATLPLSRDLANVRPEHAQALFDLRALGSQLIFSMFPRALFLAVASIVALRHGLLQRWVGMLGLAFAVIALLGSLRFLFPVDTNLYAAFDMLSVLSMFTFSLWIIASSVGLLVRSRRHAPAAAVLRASSAASVR